jgi:fused signal recognition particle receptor
LTGNIFTGKLQRLKQRLSKSRSVLAEGITRITRSGGARSEIIEQVEELLVTADIGVPTAARIVAGVDALPRSAGEDEIRSAIKREIVRILESAPSPPVDFSVKPHVIMVVGVNGTGKTTTIAKLAQRLRGQGKSVLLAASDTFRAAAIEQLEIWAGRVGAGIVKHKPGADAASVAFDACKAAVARDADVVLIDTAGRLQTKKNLMEEVTKIGRVAAKVVDGAPHEVLLVLDATTGQNAISQARAFSEACGVTGIAVAKLDGTAKGGIVVAIARELSIPITYIGTGESVDDLEPFDPRLFADALLS